MSESPLSPGSQAAVDALRERLVYEFAQPELLDVALRHSSVSRLLESDEVVDNERLEYLGDAVLQLVVSELLFHQRPTAQEGWLTTTRAQIVCGAGLAQAATLLGLGPALSLSRAADQQGARRRTSVLAAGLEAVVGAVFLDGGFAAAREVALRVLAPVLARVQNEPALNAKSALQELTQARWRQTPDYRTVEVQGPPHARRFSIEVWLGARRLAAGEGPSKRAAEQLAAGAALELLLDELATSGDQADSKD